MSLHGTSLLPPLSTFNIPFSTHNVHLHPVMLFPMLTQLTTIDIRSTAAINTTIQTATRGSRIHSSTRMSISRNHTHFLHFADSAQA